MIIQVVYLTGRSQEDRCLCLAVTRDQ